MTCFDGKIILFAGSRVVFAIDPATNTAEKVAEIPATVHCACVEGDTLYFGCGVELWKLTK